MVPCINGSVCRTSSWFCDNPATLRFNETDRTCKPFSYRSQHIDYAISYPANDSRDLLDERQKKGLLCGGADDLPICPRGFYCPDTVTMKPCEEGFFCREGSTAPRACPVLTSCGPQTGAPTNNLVGIVVFVVLLVLSIAGYCGLSALFAHRNAALRNKANEDQRKRPAVAIADPFAKADVPLEKLPGTIEKIGLDRYQTIPAAVLESLLSGKSVGGGGDDDADDDADDDGAKKKKKKKAGGKAQRMQCPFDKCSAATTIEPHSKVEDEDDADLREDVDRITFSTYFYELSLHVGSKTVLNKASGLIEAGKVTAVMGASGSGKSSFLAALSGRGRAYGTVEGSLFIKSSDDNAFRRGWLADIEDYVAFVPQDDIMTTELTVESNVKFSASYRLDRGSDVSQATERVLSALELSGVARQQVGDVEKRGISGGERKRVNIGMELVANPSVLLLDEPTSGLDASAAIKVMRLLKRVARHGTAVVAVVHQPRREIFDLFDNVLLLAKGGQVAYMGPRKGCLPFFAAHFASLPLENQNPADFLLDMVTDSRPEQLERFGSVWRAHAKAARPNISLRTKEAVERRSRKRPWGAWQMCLILYRCFVQWAVNYPSELLYAVLFFLMGMLVGLLFQDVDVDEIPQPNFLLAFVLGLASIHYSLRLFGAEQSVYWREASSGLNRLAYFGAKMIFALWPNTYLPLLMLLGFYSFSAPRGDFNDYFWAVICTHWFCSGLGFVISLLWSQQRAQMVSVIIGAVMNVVSGFFPPIPQLQVMLTEVGAFIVLSPSYSRWLQEGLFALEAKALPEIFTFKVAGTARYFGYCQTGGEKFNCDETFSRSMSIILGIGGLFRLITLLLLLVRHRGSQNRKSLTAHLVSFFLRHPRHGANDDDLSSRASDVQAAPSAAAVAAKKHQANPAAAAAPRKETAFVSARESSRESSNDVSDLGKPSRQGRQSMKAKDLAGSVVPPAASLEEWVQMATNATTGASQQPGERWFQAVYDCNAERDDELSFSRGDLMLLVDDSDPNWWMVMLHDRSGLVPSSYLIRVDHNQN
jgi:ABC-type multidrug transport system ATPase subunit